MNWSRLKAALAMFAAAAAAQPAAAQQPVVIEGAYVHGPARAVYPTAVGAFRRSDVFRYDQEGKDVSASYNLATPQGRLLITVYIYPAAPAPAAERPGRCDEEFASVKAAISSQHGDAAPVATGAAWPVPGVEAGLGHRAAYRFSTRFGGQVQEIRSEAHLYCYVGGDWLVKYRVSAPVAVETRPAVEAFIREGPWPGRSST